MGGFATLLPTLVPAVETIVDKIVTAVQGSAPTPASDPSSLSGPLATAITNANGFADAVKSKDQTKAANAAASAVPNAVSVPAKIGAQAAVDSVNANKSNVSAQLLAIRELLDLCYEAHYCVFAVFYMMNKNGKLDDGDKALMSGAWSAAQKDISAFVDQANKSLSTIVASSGAKIAFEAVVHGWNSSPLYMQIGDDIKNIGDTPSPALIANTSSLFNLLSNAAVAGGVTIGEIASGLDTSTTPAPLGAKLGRNLALMM